MIVELLQFLVDRVNAGLSKQFDSFFHTVLGHGDSLESRVEVTKVAWPRGGGHTRSVVGRISHS
jgi:hypothetical protein